MSEEDDIRAVVGRKRGEAKTLVAGRGRGRRASNAVTASPPFPPTRLLIGRGALLHVRP